MVAPGRRGTIARVACLARVLAAAGVSAFGGPVRWHDSVVTFRHSEHGIKYAPPPPPPAPCIVTAIPGSYEIVDLVCCSFDGSLEFKDHSNVVGTEYNVKVVQNDLVKVTVLPEYG